LLTARPCARARATPGQDERARAFSACFIRQHSVVSPRVFQCIMIIIMIIIMIMII